jgi:hypothetical protein
MIAEAENSLTLRHGVIIEAMDICCGRVSVRVVALALCCCAFAQQRPTEEKEGLLTTFESKVNLVLVPVVVRDSRGHAIGNLKKRGFPASRFGPTADHHQLHGRRPAAHRPLQALPRA